MPLSQFDTGNGITLCHSCHRETHHGFNRRPDLTQPMDAEGGEKIELIQRLLCVLLDDGRERGLFLEKHYALSEYTLICCCRAQAVSRDRYLEGPTLLQAYRIWRTSSPPVVAALFAANYAPAGRRPAKLR